MRERSIKWKLWYFTHIICMNKAKCKVWIFLQSIFPIWSVKESRKQTGRVLVFPVHSRRGNSDYSTNKFSFSLDSQKQFILSISDFSQIFLHNSHAVWRKALLLTWCFFSFFPHFFLKEELKIWRFSPILNTLVSAQGKTFYLSSPDVCLL